MAVVAVVLAVSPSLRATSARVATAAPATLASPGHYYVDPAGSDVAAGTTPQRAWRTLGKASTAPLRPGDRVLLKKGGTFNGKLQISASGTSGDPIVISGYGEGADPVVTGDCVELTGSYLRLTAIDVNNCTWDGVGVEGDHNRIEDSVIRNNVTGVFVRSSASGTKVLRNDIRDNNRMSVNSKTPTNDDSGAFAILLQGDDSEVAYNAISGSDTFSHDYGRDGAAVEVYGGRNNVVHHNTSHNNETFAELGHSRSDNNTFAYNLVTADLDKSLFVVTRGPRDVFGPVKGTVLLNNTVVLTGPNSGGFVCYGGCSGSVLRMRNNIIGAVSKVGFADAGFDEDYNLYFGGPRQFTPGPHSLVADPRFVSARSGDHHLSPSSPAIDRGAAVGWSSDLGGRAVPRDGDRDGSAHPDIGAYEG